MSSVTIFNEMRKRRADLARVLFEHIETDRRGEVPEGQKPFFTIPVFNWYAGSLSTIYNRTYIESARRFSDVSPLEPAQVQALDLFEGLANAPALHFQMELQAGDIQLVHNHTMLHDRTAFEDWPEPERSAACSDSGWLPKTLGLCRRLSPNGMARSYLVLAEESWFPERNTRFPGSPRGEAFPMWRRGERSQRAAATTAWNRLRARQQKLGKWSDS